MQHSPAFFAGNKKILHREYNPDPEKYKMPKRKKTCHYAPFSPEYLFLFLNMVLSKGIKTLFFLYF